MIEITKTATCDRCNRKHSETISPEGYAVGEWARGIPKKWDYAAALKDAGSIKLLCDKCLEKLGRWMRGETYDPL